MLPAERAGTYGRALFNGMAPDPQLSVSDWADRYRLLPSDATREAGQYRTSRTPYLREIQDSMGPEDPTQVGVMMKGAQIGATTAAENVLGNIMWRGGGPTMVVFPTDGLAKRWSRQKLAAMIDDCPDLRQRVAVPHSRDGDNSLLYKSFHGGLLAITGSKAPTNLRQMSCRNVLMDEVDGYVMDAGGEGDPMDLAYARTATYSSTRKVMIYSTPTVAGLSRIEKAYLATDQRLYFLPCPRCSHMQPLRWHALKWQPEAPHLVHLECEACGHAIPERTKAWWYGQDLGLWVPTAEPAKQHTRGWHLSALYSPLGWYSWADAVAGFLDAKAKGREALQVWTNTVLGETWQEQGTKSDPLVLFARREKYAAEVPDQVLVVTAGVDVQDDRLELELVGWGLGEESWSLDYRVIWGDPKEAAVWDELDQQWDRRLRYLDGAQLSVAAALIDSGGHHTQRVYEYCQRREVRRIYAAKGQGGEGVPIVRASKASGPHGRKVPLVILGVDSAKGLIYARLNLASGGCGACHFPELERYGLAFFEGLTAEQLVTRYTRGFPKRVWQKIRPRNEQLDCRVLATGALYVLDPVWDVLARARAEAIQAAISGESPQPREPQVRRSARGGYVTGYRRR